MLRVLILAIALLGLSACVSEPKDPSFIGARAFDPDEAAKTRVSLGLTYLKNGNFSQAKFNLDKALEFAPRSGQAHYAMAFYYQQVEETARAEESYEQALRYSKNDPDVLNSYGAFLCQQSKYEEAKGYFLKAVNDRNYVSTAETYENLAICSQSQGQIDEAIQYFNSALNHQPTRPKSLFLLANLYASEERWEDAKRTLFKYERNNQVSPETLYLQIQIAQGMNDTKTAVGYGEILKSMYPDHPNTKAYLANMGKFKPASTITRKQREFQVAPAEQMKEEEKLLETLSKTEAQVEGSVEAESVAEVEDSIEVEDSTKVEDSVEDAAIVAEELSADTLAEKTQEQFEDAAPEFKETAPELDDVSESDAYENVVSEASTQEAEADNAVLELSMNQEAEDDAFHIVQPKENLYRISIQYNVKMDKIKEWNGLGEDDSIIIGQRLRVRAPDADE